MFVPADKKLYIHETVDGMLSARHFSNSNSNRQLASVAGMLMSCQSSACLLAAAC